MTNLSIVSQDEHRKNQVMRSRVAKTLQPDAERLKKLNECSFWSWFLRKNIDRKTQIKFPIKNYFVKN